MHACMHACMHATYLAYWGYIGIMENKMQTTIVCSGYIGIMEKKTEGFRIFL